MRNIQTPTQPVYLLMILQIFSRPLADTGPLESQWVVVKIRVPFWVLNNAAPII